MIKPVLLKIAVIMLVISSCNDAGDPGSPQEPGTFGFDLAFLRKHDDPVVLVSGNAEVIVSPKYQGKVFTSTAGGKSGISFGWVNYKAFDAKPDDHMNAFGGENRLWLGPEGGKFSLFFKPGAAMEFAGWKTPAAYDTESWNVGEKDGHSVTMNKEMTLQNYTGTILTLKIDRKVEILERSQIFNKLGIVANDSVQVVGYDTHNSITNTGASEWTEHSGMPCIWMLNMFKPSPETIILVPFTNAANDSFNKIATTNYFGDIPDDRIKHNDSLIFFRADGRSRGKMGIHPAKAKPVAGSYDALHKVLTVTLFDVDRDAKFLNQEWRTDRAAFSGDAVNAYNDGPLADGSQMGPFYEIESVSPAAFLKPGQSLTHRHAVFHFTGSEPALDIIAQKMFGVSLNYIQKMFSND
jgi:hypothetical protein